VTAQAATPGRIARAAKLAAIGAILCLSAGIRADDELVRVTTSFDVRHAAAVLRRVSKLFNSGFERGDAEAVAREIDRLKSDQPKVWSYQVAWQGTTRPLRIRALLDEFGDVDLDFATSPDLAPHIRRSVDAYLNARGR
jgi:hypothetical protein